MPPSVNAFKKKIQKMFLNAKDKNGLFSSLRTQLRAFLHYPAKYIQILLDMLSEPMPLHAAISAGYFQQHDCIPDTLPVFMANLRNQCEQNFLKEISSPDPCIERCADLHTAFCYLNRETIPSSIPETVEKLSEAQREILFQEVGKCIYTVHDLTQEERNLLDPILKYFSHHYPEEINDSFLEQNQKLFSDLLPKETTLSELLIDAVKRRYFSYFRVLYAMFPGWHMNQREITSAELIELSFQYADSPNHLLDLLYVGLELTKEGHSYYQIKNIQKWHNQILSVESEFPIHQAVSYLYYAYCIGTEPEKLADYIHSMPVYEPDELFSEILPGHKYPLGGIFVQENTETILKQDSTLMKEYLDKIGKNNIYHFDTDLECPDADPSNQDYNTLIQNLTWKHTAEEILFFYFNTHLRKVLSLWKLKEILYNQFMGVTFTESLKQYIFTVTLYSEPELPYPVLQTSQFNMSLPPEKPPLKICIYDSYCKEHFHDEFCLDGAFTNGWKMHIRLNNTNLYLEDEAYKLCTEFLLSEEDSFYLENFYIQRKKTAPNKLSSILREIIRTNQLTEIQRLNMERLSYILTPDVENLALYADALESLDDENHQRFLKAFLLEEFGIYRMKTIDIQQNYDLFLRIWNLIKSIDGKYSFKLLFTAPFNQMLDIAEILDVIDVQPERYKRRIIMEEEEGQHPVHANYIKGKLYHRESQVEFIPDCAICEKVKIMVKYWIYRNPESKPEWDSELPLRSSIKKTEEIPEFSDGMAVTADIYNYDEKSNCFLCKVYPDKLETKRKWQEELQKKDRLSKEVMIILKRACTDDKAITDPPQKVFSEIESISAYYGDIELEDLLYDMIANRLNSHQLESIFHYLNVIKNINPYINENITPYISDDNTNFQQDERTQKLLEKVIRECSSELIARIYLETPFHLDTSLNQCLALANQVGKLPSLLGYLQGMEIYTRCFSSQLMLRNKDLDISESVQSIQLDQFSIDGCYGENILPTVPNQELKFQLIGYDTENDIVLLTDITEN